MKPLPPKKSLQFLRWFCREDYLEEFEGDLIEIFEEDFDLSPAKARRKFSWSVIRYFRPKFIKFFRSKNNLNPITMLKNDLKVSYRSLKKQPFFTFLNIFGLAIGMAGCLLISLFILDELSHDKMFQDADRIYRLKIDNRTAGETTKYAAVSPPLAGTIVRDYPQAELVTRFRGMGSLLLRRVDAEQNVKEDYVAGADSSFLKMFGLTLLEGNTEDVLKEPNTLILTKTAAQKHFGVDKALGQSLMLDNNELYRVTGVMEDLPQNSFLRNYSIFVSIEGFEDSRSIAWNNWNFPTFVKLLPDASEQDFVDYMAGVKERYLIPWAMTFVPGLTLESSREDDKKTGSFMNFGCTPLTDIHLYSENRKGEFNPNSSIQNIYILSFIGFFLILLACVNFMNLSTAHSLKRSKEVGIRKTLGSTKMGLVRQFLTEASLISLISLLFAMLIAFLTLPFFNQLADKAISIPFQQPTFWIILMVAVIVLGLFSGSYPAFFMSRFMPVKVLKGSGSTSSGGGNIRNSLVIFQFVISVFLIVCTLVVFQQLSFIQNKDLGFQKDQVLVIENVDAAGPQLESFKQEVQQLGQVKDVSLSSFLPTPSARNGTTLFPEGRVLQGESAIIIGHWRIDHDYISTLDLDIIAGRGFDRQFPTDSNAIILNESAVAMLNVQPEEALGIRLTNDFRRKDKENMQFYTVIGVVKNFHFESLRNDIEAISMILGNDPSRMMAKLSSGDFSNAIANIEQIWNRVAPGQPFSHYFMDDSFNETYKSEVRLGSIFITFTILSIFIACLGLFGLAAFNAERRTKEIGIRKVLGASISQIAYKLSINFLKLVFISIFVAIPLSWYAMNKWLQDFSYRIEIGWWIFLLAAFLAIVISVLTVSFQSIRAAIASPIKSLRSE